jgi:hypothetical protein
MNIIFVLKNDVKCPNKKQSNIIIALESDISNSIALESDIKWLAILYCTGVPALNK